MEKALKVNFEHKKTEQHDPVIAAIRPHLIEGYKTYSDITNDVCASVEGKLPKGWWAAFLGALTLLSIGAIAVIYTVSTGIGTWGLNRTVGWAFDITNFVFWIGIGHAGTLISAILLLLRQKWRTSINRSAEAMTLIAVMCAGIFPILHMGRPWFFYWILPYPNTRGSLWVNFRSPLLWDFFAISTYFLISLVFWYVGLVPDLAAIRDRAASKGKKFFYGILSLGWKGSERAWHRFERLYLLLAGLATPLVLSVHSIVSFDFATSVLPGWHTTIFPPYFVAGAILSGMAMVMTLLIPIRRWMKLDSYITLNHFENMTKVIIVTGGMVSLAYLTEAFMSFYSQNPYERFAYMNRLTGPYAFGFFIMILCNVIIPQLFWIKKLRRSIPAIFIMSIFINIGMWFERFIIIVTSLHRDFLPSSWAMYAPTITEIAILIGSFGLFFTMFLLFLRFFPVISIHEVKGLLHQKREK